MPTASGALEAEFAKAAACIDAIGTADPRAERMVVAGHGYGSHGGDNEGLYPPLLAALGELAATSQVVGLTGDISRSGSLDSFTRIDNELSGWPTVLAAPGNHDVGSPESRAAFESVFGQPFGSRVLGDSLVLWIDTDVDDWRISGEQLQWMRQALSSNDAKAASSVVVLTHHLIWSRGDRSDFPVNGGPRDRSAARDPDQLQQLLEPLGKPVLVISGDVGAFPEQVSIACDIRGPVSYVASGVGGGLQDTVLVVALSPTPTVHVCRVGGDGVDEQCLAAAN